MIVDRSRHRFHGRPFEPMPRLLAVAEEITKLLAICMRCGNPAVHTQRLVASEELIVVGAGGMYEARCRRCFEPQLAQQKLEEKSKQSEEAGPAKVRAPRTDRRICPARKNRRFARARRRAAARLGIGMPSRAHHTR